MGKIDDERLVKLLQKGNVAAFDSLFDCYSQKLFFFALKYLKNESDAEELVQVVFVKVWENRQSLKSEFSFKSYLFTIALNQIRKYFNKKAVSLRYLKSLQNEPEFTEIQVISDSDFDSAFRKIKLIIEQLPPRRREIFIKSKFTGKSSNEIATELNISARTVDNQVSEALRFIRSRLNTENFVLLFFVFLFFY